ATHQPRAGIAKHDQVAWALARKADAAGIDIIQNTEVTGILTAGGRVTGVETTRGTIHAGQVSLCGAPHSSQLAEMAGGDLPIQSHPLKALGTDSFEPVHPTEGLKDHVNCY